MALLEQFRYDVFLSYGWAGIDKPDEGDRGWVATFRHQLQIHLSGALGYAARIYLDVEDSQNGELPNRLDEAVSSSAIFLSVISPGSCRPDSWCRTELTMFDDAESLLLAGRKQIFSIMLRTVPKETWPDGLQSMTPIPFHNERGAPVPRAHLEDTAEAAGDMVQSLAMDIAQVLHNIEQRIWRTVFVGWTAPSLEARVARLTREIQARGSQVITVKDRPDEPEAGFCGRVERLARNANIAVLLVPGTGGTTRQGWSNSVESLQIQATARRFEKDQARLIVWNEPVPGQGVAAAHQVEGQRLHGTGFEYVLDVINESVVKFAGTSRLTAVLRDDDPARYVFVKCLPQDAARLATIRQAIEAKGMRMRLPIFEGDERRRDEINVELIQRSKAVAVYFGSLNDLEAYDACQTVARSVPANEHPVPKAVLLDPDTDPIRQNFWYPDFQNYPSSSIERVVEHLVGETPS